MNWTNNIPFTPCELINWEFKLHDFPISTDFYKTKNFGHRVVVSKLMQNVYQYLVIIEIKVVNRWLGQTSSIILSADYLRQKKYTDQRLV